MTNIAIVNFNSGELSPELDARKDIEKYVGGCRRCENMIPDIYGNATRRPGTELIPRRDVHAVTPVYVYPTLHALTSEMPSILAYENTALSYENDVAEIPDNITIPIFACWENDIICWENESVITSGEIVNSRNVICYENDFIFYENDIVVALIEIPTRPSEPSITPALGATVFTQADVATMDATMAGAPTGHYKLGGDIDLVGGWTPVANFAGVFDGQGYTISNLSIDASGSDYQGLFASLDDDAEIYNLNFVDCTVIGKEGVAILAGNIITKTGIVLKDITFTDCIVTGRAYAGCLIGLSYEPGGMNVFRCYTSNCDINVSVESGGSLIGYHERDPAQDANTFVDCYAATGTVDSSTGSGNAFIGGMVGEAIINYLTATTNKDHWHGCYTESALNPTQGNFVGGFVGACAGMNFTTCYATGDITVDNESATPEFIGGFVGACEDGSTFTNCYATGDLGFDTGISTIARVGGFAGKLECGALADNVDTTLLRCYSMGDITATGLGWKYVGGFVGAAWPGTGAGKTSTMTIERCFAWGDIAITESEADPMSPHNGGAGGFCGGAENFRSDAVVTLTFLNCYAWGDIVDSEIAARTAAYGGFLGFYDSTNAANTFSFTNCYDAQTNTELGSSFTDKIPSGTNSHGFASAVETGVVTTFATTACFYDTTTSSLSTSTSGVGHITSWMMAQSNYTDADWDFGDIWEMAEVVG